MALDVRSVGPCVNGTFMTFDDGKVFILVESKDPFKGSIIDRRIGRHD